MADLFSAPIFSSDRTHRYTLPRVVAPGISTVAFVMLNPSKADEAQDDPTIRRCIGFARAWGYSRLLVGNLFAFRATDPREMKRAADPIGAENDEHLVRIASAADLVVCAWGQHGKFGGRADAVTWMLRRHRALHALELAGDGTPKHPLYLRGDLLPLPWKARRGEVVNG